MPQVRFWNLGLGADVSFREVRYAGGTAAAAAVEDRGQVAALVAIDVE